MKTRSLMLIAAASTILTPRILMAHHNFRSVFSNDLPVEVTGTVTEVRWTNPHARFYLDVRDENGEVVNWNFELASPSSLMRRGWRADSLKPGDVVTVNGFRARNVPNLANTMTVILSDGERVFGTLSSPPE